MQERDLMRGRRDVVNISLLIEVGKFGRRGWTDMTSRLNFGSAFSIQLHLQSCDGDIWGCHCGVGVEGVRELAAEEETFGEE
jgi:hypothetical protein